MRPAGKKWREYREIDGSGLPRLNRRSGLLFADFPASELSADLPGRLVATLSRSKPCRDAADGMAGPRHRAGEGIRSATRLFAASARIDIALSARGRTLSEVLRPAGRRGQAVAWIYKG